MGIMILGPRARLARLQLLVAGGLMGAAMMLVAIFGDRFDFLVAGAIALMMSGGLLAYYDYWMRSSAPTPSLRESSHPLPTLS